MAIDGTWNGQKTALFFKTYMHHNYGGCFRKKFKNPNDC